MKEIEHRLHALRENFSGWEIDALLIDNPTNRRWLSGFTGSSGSLLVTGKRAILATDSRYWEQVRIEAPDFELFPDRRRDEDTVALVKSVDAKRIGIEANHITLANANKLLEIEGLTWVPLHNPVEPLRFVKETAEIERIRAAAAITDQAMGLVPHLARAGMAESDLAWELEKNMREAGADALAFPTIVAFGSNSALPHHHPGSRVLQPGEIVLVDMGADVGGYKSDLTRTFWFGNEPDAQFVTLYGLVASALQAAARQIRSGITSDQAHDFAMSVIAEGGHGDHFPHGLGHGVGLDIHEQPFLSSRPPVQEITDGMILTIEPGIYLPGWGGIRLEDLVLVTKSGVEYISRCPKTPQISP